MYSIYQYMYIGCFLSNGHVSQCEVYRPMSPVDNFANGGPSLSQLATCLYSNYLRAHAATDLQLSTAKVHSLHMHYIRQTFRWPLSISLLLKRQPTSNLS
jgi:hypothetical protein